MDKECYAEYLNKKRANKRIKNKERNRTIHAQSKSNTQTKDKEYYAEFSHKNTIKVKCVYVRHKFYFSLSCEI